MTEAYIKPFAGVRHAHYAAAAALALRPRIGDAMSRSITLHTYAEALHYAGNRAPTAPIAAQFSLSWAVSAALAQGDLGSAAFTAAALSDPRLRAMEALVTLAEDPAFSPGRRGACLSLQLSSSETVEATIEGVTGGPARPMLRTEAVAKFRRYARLSLDADATEAALSALLGPAEARPGGAVLGEGVGRVCSDAFARRIPPIIVREGRGEGCHGWAVSRRDAESGLAAQRCSPD